METPLGLMVQRKWDGDRLQAHVHPKGEGAGRVVQLFTRNAKVRSLSLAPLLLSHCAYAL